MRPIARLLRARPRAGWSQPPIWSLSDSWTPSPSDREKIEANFESYVRAAYKGNGVIFACGLTRLLIFSEARFLWRRFREGRPTDLFGSEALALLEQPWPNGTTGELLARMEQDTSLAGNFYATIVGRGAQRRIRRLRPDWVTIVTGIPLEELTREERESRNFEPHPFDLRARPVAYLYEPRSVARRAEPQLLMPEQLCHWSPIPDPEAQWRGMSWLSPVIDEITADKAATKHKLKFFEAGATPRVVVSYDAGIAQEQFDYFVANFKRLEGLAGAYKTLHLGGGADPKVIGTDLKQLDFKVTQGAGESRVAAAAGTHPVIVGLSEGLAGSSLNAGNFNAARRLVADRTIRPLWRSAAAALETIIERPAPDVHLWYDDRDVPFLREDAKDTAEIRQIEATTVETLIRGGFTPESAVRAVTTGDFASLEHTGLPSVQLQPPEET